MMMRFVQGLFLPLAFFIFSTILAFGKALGKTMHSAKLQVGAAQMDVYLPMLKDKRVALLMNQTAEVNGTLLLDTLLKRGVRITKIFVPEHGFRGTADAGAYLKNETDAKTGLPVISLYGKNKKPNPEQMKDIDVLVYDLQDVGVRFYTYISTLEYAIEACIENHKQLLVLDRPNPNRHIVDGPVLDSQFRSFVGMQPVPVLYGMTVGEYAQMLIGEGWIPRAKELRMNIVQCSNHTNQSAYEYQLPVPPSPNLKSMNAIRFYPGLCFFEGTIVSVGRGTDAPFEQWGHPDYEGKLVHHFIPQSTLGASKPLLEGKTCFGERLHQMPQSLDLSHLIKAYQLSPQKEKFFNTFFEKLAGTKLLRQQIIEGKTEAEIRVSWQAGLDRFKKIRSKYLLYED